MNTKNNKPYLLFSIFTLAAILLSACGASNAEPTATPFSVDAVYTAAAETLSAQLTNAALAAPSATMTVTASPSNTPPATETRVGLATNTAAALLIVNTPIPLATFTAGPSPTPTGSATSRTLGCNDSTFISHVTYPDKATVQPGQSFTKIWEIKNSGSGTCVWTNDYRLVFVGGNILGSDSTRIGQKVGIGATARVRLEMVAPTAPGTYTSQWRMATPNWESFGAVLTVIIVVPGPTHTATSAASATNTSAPATATNTNTPIPPTATFTFTPEPTSTFTETPTPNP